VLNVTENWELTLRCSYPALFSTKGLGFRVVCPLCHRQGLPAAEGDDRNLRLGIMHPGILSIYDDEGVL
jgi:hypothetical protein